MSSPDRVSAVSDSGGLGPRNIEHLGRRLYEWLVKRSDGSGYCGSSPRGLEDQLAKTGGRRALVCAALEL